MVYSLFGSAQLRVLGIGTVEIPTKRSPNRSGVACHGSIHLKEVLHVPDIFCNILGNQLDGPEGYDVQLGFKTGSATGGTVKDRQGRTMAYFDPKKPLLVLKLRVVPTGPKLGPSVFKQDGALYMLNCRWDPAERQKWENFKALNNTANSSGSARVSDEVPPYTDEEKAYLKYHYRNEFDFLRICGRSIYKEEDRAEGRSLLRSLMAEDEDEGEEDDEFDYEGHQADYNFSSEQLDWIDKYYGNSEAFMVSYGLKFYDNDDVEEAKAIAQAMINADAEEEEEKQK